MGLVEIAIADRFAAEPVAVARNELHESPGAGELDDEEGVLVVDEAGQNANQLSGEGLGVGVAQPKCRI